MLLRVWLSTLLTNQFQYRAISSSYCPEFLYNNKSFFQCRQSLSDLYKLLNWDKYISAKNITILCSSSHNGLSNESDLTKHAHCSKECLAMQEVPKLSIWCVWCKWSKYHFKSINLPHHVKKEGTNKRCLQKQIHLLWKKKAGIIWKLNVDLQMERPIRSFIPSLPRQECFLKNISCSSA